MWNRLFCVAMSAFILEDLAKQENEQLAMLSFVYRCRLNVYPRYYLHSTLQSYSQYVYSLKLSNTTIWISQLHVNC